MAEYIKREAAMTTPVLPKEYRKYQTENLDDAYEQGWMDALDNLKNVPAVSVPQWISVKDRLPRDGEIVLCYTRWGFAVLQFDAEYHFWIDSNDCHSDSHILYWMPLPKAPKGEKDD